MGNEAIGILHRVFKVRIHDVITRASVVAYCLTEYIRPVGAHKQQL